MANPVQGIDWRVTLVDSSGAAVTSLTTTTAGTKTNNNAAPGTDHIGALTALASNAAPTWTEGNEVLLSATLGGNLRVTTGTQTLNVAGTTSGGSAFVGPSVAIGFVGTGGTHRNGTAANSLGSTTGNDIFGVGNMVKDTVGGNYFNQLGDASGRAIAVGAAASGAAVAGNPVLMGVSDGTNAQVWRSALAQTSTQAATVYPGVACLMAGAASDFRALQSANAVGDGTGGAGALAIAGYDYSGAGWDKRRMNEDRILLASALRSGTSGPTALVTYNHRAVYFILDTTVHTGSGIVKLVVDYIDPASGKAINLLTGANVVAATTNVYKIGIGLTAAANLVAVEYLARNLQWTVTLVSGTSVTYSLGCCLMPA